MFGFIYFIWLMLLGALFIYKITIPQSKSSIALREFTSTCDSTSWCFCSSINRCLFQHYEYENQRQFQNKLLSIRKINEWMNQHIPDWQPTSVTFVFSVWTLMFTKNFFGVCNKFVNCLFLLFDDGFWTIYFRPLRLFLDEYAIHTDSH